MKGLLSTIWERVLAAGPAPVFQTMEEAHIHLNFKLQNLALKQRLLVLDDVWSTTALQNLSFQVPGLKTMITTRQSAEFLHARDSLSYNLSLLNETDAKSLFCYWAFEHDSIPDWIDVPFRLVVNEVIEECKGLPLALKVIGTSLFTTSDDPPAWGYWRHTRDKLREAGLLGE
ncbi:hypothetical protein L7F22_065328 [Adiantum nelumboides]|nr:hypothetical protein [Adiantum nelumboides]